jgi:hypothetical protein
MLEVSEECCTLNVIPGITQFVTLLHTRSVVGVGATVWYVFDWMQEVTLAHCVFDVTVAALVWYVASSTYAAAPSTPPHATFVEAAVILKADPGVQYVTGAHTLFVVAVGATVWYEYPRIHDVTLSHTMFELTVGGWNWYVDPGTTQFVTLLQTRSVVSVGATVWKVSNWTHVVMAAHCVLDVAVAGPVW